MRLHTTFRTARTRPYVQTLAISLRREATGLSPGERSIRSARALSAGRSKSVGTFRSTRGLGEGLVLRQECQASVETLPDAEAPTFASEARASGFETRETRRLPAAIVDSCAEAVRLASCPPIEPEALRSLADGPSRADAVKGDSATALRLARTLPVSAATGSHARFLSGSADIQFCVHSRKTPRWPPY